MKNSGFTLALMALAVLFTAAWAVPRFFFGTSNLSQISPHPSSQSPDEALPAEPTAAYDFEMTDSNGELMLLSDLYGKPIVLNFWASWCPPCKAEMPHFQAMYDKYGEEVTFVMLVLLADPRESPEKAKAFMDDNGYTLPYYLDTQNEAALLYGVTSIPRTYTIDSSGNFVAGASAGERFIPGHIGAVSEKALEAYILELLD